MELVQPIKDLNVMKDLKKELGKGKFGKRNLFMFELGLNAGMRISDLLALRVKDVRGVTHIKVKEQKTDKLNHFYVAHIEKIINKYTNGMQPDDYLFPSRQQNKHINRGQAYHILKTASIRSGHGDLAIGCHSLRKSWGYHLYKGGTDISELMSLLNHSSQAVTLRYIGIERENLDKAVARTVL